MGKLSSLLWGAAIGAGTMYFMDPQQGNRRKAMIRDQVYRLQNRADDALETSINDFRNRARGLLSEGMAFVSDEPVSDQLLEERVRSRLGFLSRHSGAIQVTAHNHAVTLSGDILANEVDNLIKGVSHVRGVQGVDNRLRVHQEAGNIPQLQGEGWLPGDNGGQWSPSTRFLAGVGSVYLFFYGMIRGGLIGTLAQGGALFLGTRALTNLNVRQLTGTGEEGGAVRVRKSMHIEAPVTEVYGLWSNFENFARFMENIESIKNTGGNKSHWVVKGPAGSKVEFDAVMTENKPNQLIAWETTPDSTVKHQGQVRFRETGQQGTQVNVQMAYTPPAGVAGAAVAALFGKDPKSEMDTDLARMKSLLEEGKTTVDKNKVTRDQVMPVTGRGGQGGQSQGQKSSMQQSGEQTSSTSSGGGSQRSRSSGSQSGGGTSGSDTGGSAPLAPSDQ